MYRTDWLQLKILNALNLLKLDTIRIPKAYKPIHCKKVPIVIIMCNTDDVSKSEFIDNIGDVIFAQVDTTQDTADKEAETYSLLMQKIIPNPYEKYTRLI